MGDVIRARLSRLMAVNLERFDVLMGATITVIILAIIGIIGIGDRAGVSVRLLDPRTTTTFTASSLPVTLPLTLQFSEVMNPQTVRLQIMPQVSGKLEWSGAQLIFRPDTAFSGGVTYTITLEAGAEAMNGRKVLQSAAWSIKMATPSVIFLYPAIPNAKKLEPPNLYRVVAPGAPEQLTNLPRGVEDFAPSPDGTSIAFTQRDASGKMDVYLLRVTDKSVRQLTNCVQAACRAPDWSPDGHRIVYERADNSQPDSDSRAWILDVSTLATEPLFVEQRWLGKSPRWSRDGRWITMYDHELGGVVIVEVATGQRSVIQSLETDSGRFAPDSARLVYGQIALTEFGALRGLEIASFNIPKPTVRPLGASDGALTDDTDAAWNPDGKRLAVMRRYINDARFTEKFQVYEVDAETGESRPLVVDPAFAHGYLSWSADGAELLLQRFPYTELDAQPGIWIYDSRSRTLTKIAQNGFMPKWLS
jgi:Tol biopolymer transport system component